MRDAEIEKMTDKERLKWMLAYCFITSKKEVSIRDPNFIEWMKKRKDASELEFGLGG
ncbi:MAG: hypothetical protein ACTSSA_12525 [Candidatus Freyarchaeota archaeon]